MSFGEAWAAVGDIDGWLTEEQGRMLYASAAATPDSGRVVEIGSHHGRSTIILAKGAPLADIVSVDPYEEHEPRPQDLRVFEQNLDRAGVRDRVRHVHATSTQALQEFAGDVDLLYIDGAHDLGTALADIRGWGARVRPGGTMLIHDSFSSVGVTVAELLALFFGGRFEYLGRSRTLAEYRRQPVRGPARIANAARQASGLPWFARNVLVKLAVALHVLPLARALGHRDDVFPY